MPQVLKLAGWPALIIIVIAIVGAEILKAHRFIRCGLWLAAAGVAAIGAWNACRQR